MSVVIPTYNSGPLVVEAVESVLAQTRPADEVLVIDDGSTDDTANRLARFGPPVRVFRKENGGVATARNRGIAESTGDVIAFLDADDVWHPRKLELQLPVLAAQPEIGMLGAYVYDWPAVSHPALAAEPVEPVHIPLHQLVVLNQFDTSTVLVRREVLSAVGDFDTDQSGTEDYDLWLRIAQRAAVANLPVTLAGYCCATRPGALSKNAVRMESGMQIILRKLEAAGVFDGKPLLRRMAWARFRSACGLRYREAGRPGIAVLRFVQSLVAWPLWTPSWRGSPDRRWRALLVSIWRVFTKSDSHRPSLTTPPGALVGMVNAPGDLAAPRHGKPIRSEPARASDSCPLEAE